MVHFSEEREVSRGSVGNSGGHRGVKYSKPRGTTLRESNRKWQPLFQEIGVTGKQNREDTRW